MRIQLSACVLDLDKCVVVWPDHEVSLTPTEVALLAYLLAKDGGVASQDELGRDVWNWRSAIDSAAIPVAVRRLRTKLEKDPAHPDHLLTVRGSGFRFAHAGRLDEPTPPMRPESQGVRAREQGQLAELLANARLVTIVGPGGAGKTWLARQTGERMVDLETAVDRDSFIRTVAQALHIPLSVQDPDEHITRALQARGKGVLVLDNLEQVHDAARDVLRTWLASTELTFVTTSRVALGLEGEAVLPLSPLPSQDAHALYVAIVRRTAPSFDLGPEEDEALRELVDRLDGLPLAVELAASRAAVLPPTVLLERLARGTADLKSQTLPHRQSSLWRCISWSWDLLGAPARTAFAACSVFRGSFHPREALVVLGDDAPDHLEELTRQSLLVALPTGRLRLLETLREFASAKLDDPAARSARRAHAAAYLALARRNGDRAVLYGDPVAVQALVTDLDNILAAHAHALTDDPATAAEIAVLLVPVLVRRGPVALALRLTEALPQDVDPSLLARVYIEEAGVRFSMNDVAGIEAALSRAEQAAEAAGDPVLKAHVSLSRAWKESRSAPEPQVRARFEDAIALLEAHGETRRAMHGRLLLGWWLANLERPAPAAEPLHIAVAWFRAEGLKSSLAQCLDALRQLYFAERKLDLARQMAEEALALEREMGNALRAANLLQRLANIALHEGRLDDSMRIAREAAQEAESVGFLVARVYALGSLGWAEIRSGAVAQGEATLDLALRLAGPHGKARGTILLDLATSAGLAGQPARSLDFAEQAHRSFQALGDRGAAGDAVCLMAMAQSELGDADAARALLAGLDRTTEDPSHFLSLARAFAEGRPVQDVKPQLPTSLRDEERIALDRLARLHG